MLKCHNVMHIVYSFVSRAYISSVRYTDILDCLYDFCEFDYLQ